MEDSFRSKGSYSRSQYSESMSSDLMKQLSSDVTVSSNSSKKSNKIHHPPKLGSKSFYPEEYDDPRDINNQQANYTQNQHDNFYNNNNGNVYRQPPPRFAQNQNYNKNYNKGYYHQNNNNNNYPRNQGYGGSYNNNNNYYNQNKNYHNKKFSKGPYPKHQSPAENSGIPFSIQILIWLESSESASNNILMDLSYEEPINKTINIAQKFHVHPKLVGFNEEEKDEDEDEIEFGQMLEGMTTEEEKDSDSQGGQKRKSKQIQKFILQGLGVELHNVLENRLTLTKMKIELPCSECTFLAYQVLAKKEAKDLWISKSRKCKVCFASSKNILQIRYNGKRDCL